MASNAEKFETALTFRGRPLLRKGDEIYYGSMGDPFILYMKVNTKRKAGDYEIASRVSWAVMRTDETLDLFSRVVKSGEKNGIYSALDIGSIALERAMQAEKK